MVGGGWVLGGGWVVDGGSPAPRDGRVSSKKEFPPVCFLFHTRSSRTNQLTVPRVPRVLLYVLLHCCPAVCSKGLVGGWVECTLRRPWWVGGPFCTWESFCVLWGMNLLFCFYNTGLPLVLWSTTVPTAALLCPLLPYVLLHCRTAAVLSFLFGILTYQVQRMIPLLVRTYCCIAVLLPYDYFVLLQHQFVFVRHTGRQQAYFGSTTSPRAL